ncbi:MAG: hypothetical protein OEV73_12395, partial [Desulfobulbaceae bacterium]|nr:hypothetical protein [Desulfobulbaceae bacterium]
MKALWLALALLLVSGGVAFAQDACDYFYQALAAAPHEKLTHRIGELQGQHDGKWHQGCEMVLTTDERLLAGGALPDFQAGPGSESYRAGWRDNLAYSADGPGTSLYAIERGGDLC